YAVGQGMKLGHVIVPFEGPGPQRVGIGHGDLLTQGAAIGQGDLHAAAEGLLRGVFAVVPAGPLGVLGGADLVPQGDGVGPLGALGSIGTFVVPLAVLQRHGHDVGDGVVEGLPGGAGVVFLWVVRSGADHVVGVVAGV